MEAHCPPGQINISETVAGYVKALFELEARGTIKAKHDRPYRMFFLNHLKPEFASTKDGRAPHVRNGSKDKGTYIGRLPYPTPLRAQGRKIIE